MKKKLIFKRLIMAFVVAVSVFMLVAFISEGTTVFAWPPAPGGNNDEIGPEMIELQDIQPQGDQQVNLLDRSLSNASVGSNASNNAQAPAQGAAPKKLDAGACRERCKSVAQGMNALSGAIAALIKGGSNTDFGPHAVNILKAGANIAAAFLSPIPGLGDITNAFFDGFVAIVEATDGAKQSDTDRLMSFISDQIDLVRDDIAKTRQDVAELSSMVDEGFDNILKALKDSFENYEAKTRVNDFFSTTSGKFSYTQLKRYLYSNYTDGYAMELAEQTVKEKPNQERVKQLQDDLYYSLMSSSSDRTSYLEMFYDSIMRTESHRSIFEYYTDFLNSNTSYLNGTSAALASAEFINDVYSTFLNSVNYVRTLTAIQGATMFLQIEDMQTVDLDSLTYKYGPGQNDYVSYTDLEKIEKRLNEMVDNVDYQVAKDIAYVLKLDKTYFYKAGDKVLRVAYNTKAETFGNVEKGYTIQFPEINQAVANLFGYNVANFRYYLTDSNNQSLNRGKEKDTTYVVDTDKPFTLTVKYEVKDKAGRPVMTTDANGNSVPLIYDLFQMNFRVGVTNTFSGGSGKADDPYVITNASQFNLIRLNDRHTCYSLITNLDLKNATVIQMFDDITPYAGTFDGNGFEISNFTIDKSKSQPSIFGYISSTGKVTNLKVKNAEVNKDNDDDSKKIEAAIIACVNNGEISNIIIEKCTVKTVRVSKTNNENINKSIVNYAGAIAAENYGTIKYCKVHDSTINAFTKRNYGANQDGLNSNDVYAGGIVGYNGSNAVLSYVATKDGTTIRVEAISWADKSFSTRRPYVKAHGGGIAGAAGNRTNINNLYCGSYKVTASTGVNNDSAWGGYTRANASNIAVKYIPNETSSSIERQSDFDFPSADSYTVTMYLSGKVDPIYNIDESLIFNPGANSFHIAEMKFKITNVNKGETKTYNGAILSVKNFDTTNDSMTTGVRRDLEALIYIPEIKKVIPYSIPYIVLPDSPKRIDVSGAGITQFNYSDNAENKIVDALASTTLGTDNIRIVLASGKSFDVSNEATISIDTTKYGKQKAIIKSNGFTDNSFEVTVKCDNHSFTNEEIVVEGAEKYEDSVNHNTYFKLYGYKRKECSNCHQIIEEPFNSIYETEVINAVAPTCSTVGYTGDRVPYYIYNNEKVYLDYILEKGTAIDVLPHTYLDEDEHTQYDDNNHRCSVCGHLEPHYYSLVETEGIINGLVYKCETCGHTIIREDISREIITSLPRVVVNDAYSLAGTNQVVVYVDLHANVGITSANFSIIFDPNLKLVSYRLGNILNDANISRFKVYSDHLNVVLAQTSTDVSTDGTILKLVFETPANATPDDRYKIDVVNKGNTDRFTDKNGNKLEFLSYEGYINIVDHLPGDVNGDGKLDMLDVLIVSKYIVLDESEKVNYIKEISALNPDLSIGYADVNLDNIIDTDDVVRMLRFDVGGYESQVISQKFIVNLNYNDGTGTVVPHLVDYNYGRGLYGDLPTVNKEGYRFDGWYTSLEGGTQITSASHVKYNSDQYVQTLYAHFTLNKIIFDSNGGVGKKEEITIYTNPDYMNFSITDKNGKLYMTKESKVVFDVNVDDETLNKENLYAHEFLGWSTTRNGNVISNISSVYDLANFKNSRIGTITLYAVWKPIDIINYIPDTSGLPGYNFTGWMTKKNGKEADVVLPRETGVYTVTDSVTFYARFDLVSYKLVYDANGGADSTGLTMYFEEGSTVSNQTQSLTTFANTGFTREGYTFEGWTTSLELANSWFTLEKKNYNEKIAAFNYEYYDGKFRTIQNTDFVFVDGASLQASANPDPAVTRNIKNFITAGLVKDLEDFVDDLGFVTLYAIWTPDKIEITYEVGDEADTVVLKGTTTKAKDNPVTLPYYYGYDIILPFDLYIIKEGSHNTRIESITINQITDKPYSLLEDSIIYAWNIPAGNRTLSAHVEMEQTPVNSYVHYLYNGSEIYTYVYHHVSATSITFIKDLSAIGLSSEYYAVNSFLSIVDQDGMDGHDTNGDNQISENEKYINIIRPDGTYYRDDEIDLYIELRIIGESKLYANGDSPLRYDYNELWINGNGDFSAIKNSSHVLIIPDLFRVNGELRTVYTLTRSNYQNSNYYDNGGTEEFTRIIFGKSIKNIYYNALDDYLLNIEEMVLPNSLVIADLGESAPNLKRIILSDMEYTDRLFIPTSNNLVDIYYRGDLASLNRVKAESSNSELFDTTKYRIRCYSETKPTDVAVADFYWYNDRGVIKVWAN